MHKLIKNTILPKVMKPARYIGNELNSIHKDHSDKIKFALCYPDSYEIGMSNLGLQILYHLINQRPDCVAERLYCPWPDMEQELQKHDIPLFTLESWSPVKDFDILGFSIQNELTYTNLLNILKLSKIPLKRNDRETGYPLVIAGGACTNNPAPLEDIIDIFVLGDGEEVIMEIIDTVKLLKGQAKNEIISKLCTLEGVYAPGHNDFSQVKRRFVKDINLIDYPTKPILPFLEIVHDRITIEIMRGCPRRCSFCQASSINKPVRMLKPERVVALAKETAQNTGLEEVSLVSLSSSDYPWLLDVAKELGRDLSDKRISLSLPSLRADTFSDKISKEIQNVRKSGITIAPEAGTQRLRDLICKDLTEEDIINATRSAFASGTGNIKLYFMIGLPTETEEDIAAIVELSNKILRGGKAVNPRARVTVNVSTFIPKKNTPLENEKMITFKEISEKQGYLKNNLKRNGGMELKWHKPEMSIVEGIFACGEKNTGKILLDAFEMGCRFDNWDEYFDWTKWEKAIAENTANIL